MTGTNQGTVPTDHVVNQEYITFCGRPNYSVPDGVYVYVDTTYSTIGAVVVATIMQVVGVTVDDAITATDTVAFGAPDVVVSVMLVRVLLHQL